MDGLETPGRRERKKARTREALRASARRLFAQQGFAATTVQQIADAADVSERTFFRYFESKEDLLLPDVVAMFEVVERAIRGRPRDEQPLTAILEAFTGAIDGSGVAGGATLLAPGLGPADAVLAGRLARAFVDWEDRLAGVLLERFRAADATALDDELALHAAVIARAAVSAARTALRTLRGRQADGALPPAAVLEVLRAAFAILAAGCPSPDRPRR